MNKLEKIYKEIKEKDNIEKTSIICSNLFIETIYDFRVFISIQIPVFTDYDPYKNESLVMTLNVEKDGQIEKWLELKKSSINDGGFGVFAAREFSADEFVTVYLGKKCDVTLDLEIFWHYQAISSQMVSKKSTGSVIGSTMLVVKETIW